MPLFILPLICQPLNHKGAISSAQVPFQVKADGLHIGPVSKPSNVEHAFVFRIHLDGSQLGFLAFDRPDLQQPRVQAGENHTLRWLSGAPGVGNVSLEKWSHAAGAWQSITRSGGCVPNTGSYLWRAPETVDLPLLLRLSALAEPTVEHVVQMPVGFK